MKRRDQTTELKKKREAEEKAKKEEEEKAAKKAAEDALPEDEKLKVIAKREAEAFKAQGNEFYKKKSFEEALNFYQ